MILTTSYKNVILALIYTSFYLVLNLASFFFINISNLLGFFLVSSLLYIIPLFFLLKRNITLFEPITLFLLYSLVWVIIGFYYLYIPFNETRLGLVTNFSKDYNKLFNLSFFYINIGVICTIIGYYFFRRRISSISLKFDDQYCISDKVLILVIPLFLLLGILNFIYNVYDFGGGSIANIFKHMGHRGYRSSIIKTTFFYQFTYWGLYIWIYYLLRNKKRSYLIVLFIIVAFIMNASNGRITQTLVMALNFITIYYFYEISNGKRFKDLNRKYLTYISIFIVSIILLYFLRVLTGKYFSSGRPEFSTEFYIETFKGFFSSEQLGYNLIEKGKLPNLPILMKIIDSWNQDIGFLYGSSLISWPLDILPNSILPDQSTYVPSAIIAKTWYSGHVLGGQPPTGIGEMYANFGVLGPFIGMFLFGGFAALLFNLLIKYPNYWMLLVFSEINNGFIFRYMKGQFNNLDMLDFLPYVLIYFILRWLTFFLRKNSAS